MSFLNNIRTGLLATLLSSFALGPIAHADDTEIFFGQSKDAFNTNPNVLFVLDTSGSMGYYDGTNMSRMDRMKIAMRVLLRESSSYNVGLMGFSGTSKGGSIHYPVGDLEADSGSLCPDGICPDERVVVKPELPSDDGTQIDDDPGVVDLHAPELVMAEVITDNIDGGVRSPEISGSAYAVAIVAETEVGSTANTRNMTSSTRWFFDGTDTINDDRYAYRFENVDIPKGAVITSANITFSETSAITQVGNLSALIKLEWNPDADPYPAPTNSFPPIAARLITATPGIEWNNIPPDTTITGTTPDATTPVSKTTTPDLSSIVKNIIDLPNWQSGNPLSFILDPVDEYDPSNADIREYHGIDAAESLKPVLNYTYTTAVDTNTTESIFEATAHVDEITLQEENAAIASSISHNLTNTTSRAMFASALHKPRELMFRFDNIDIPADAEIQSVSLQLHATDDATTESPITDWQMVLSGSGGVVGSSVGSPGNLTEPPPNSAVGGDSPPDNSANSADTYTMNFAVKAESTGSPAPYDSVPVVDRTFSTIFAPWDDVTITPGEDLILSTPKLGQVIKDVIKPGNWTSGQSLSIGIEAPTANYENVLANSGLIDTATGVVPPKLFITWKTNTTVSSTLKNTQTTAIRFANVHVPPQAQIKSARLAFTASKASVGPVELNISAEKAASSAPFTAADNNLKNGRTQTDEKEPWAVEPWDLPTAKYYSDDISKVIQEVVDLGEWCGGNPLTIFLEKLSGSDSRYAVSADQNEVSAPTLEITYAPETVQPGAYCSNATFLSSVSAGSDDATQDMQTNNVDLTAGSLDSMSASGHTQKIGMIFPSLGVPKGAVIVSAKLDMIYEKDITAAQDYKFEAIKTVETPAFDDDTNKIISDNRVPFGIEVIANAPTGLADDGVFRVDVAPLITAKVNDEDWIPGKPVVITAEALNGIAQSFYSYETDEARAPQLVVYYQSQREKPGTLFRDNLIAIVDSMIAQSGTPIVSAYYEASQYYTGSPIDYGLQRGWQGWQDGFHRVSHPLSYTGGIVYREDGCEESNLSSPECETEEILSDGGATPTYISPIESECQQNHIVLLSDGVPTSNTAKEKVRAKTGDASCIHSGNQACGYELAKWLHETDLDPLIDGEQTVTTHTIGFNLTEPQFLKDIANAGGGQFYAADSASELLNAFKNIFINVSKTDTSFVAPSATVSQSNRLKNREDIYFSLFKPEGTARWAGNLKRYKLAGIDGDNADILDVNDALAIDDRTGRFFQTAKSYWSDVVDGDSVLLGGAAEKLEDDGQSHEERNVYTYTGHDVELSSMKNQLLPGNTYLNRDWLSLTATLANDDAYVTDLINWSHGQDLFDIDGDGDTNEPRGQMGDPMHSQPLLVNYADGRSVVHVATNEGFLHGIDHATGEENFAFIPKELLPNLRRLYENQPTRNRPYGLDGGMTLWIDDDNNDGMVDPATDKAYLYIGMRRGGNLYYALDITEPDNPKYLWSIAGGAVTNDEFPTNADGDFTELGDTWSKPIKTKLYDNVTTRDVLIFGAGYGSNQDPVAEVEAAPIDPNAVVDPNAEPVDNRQTREEDTVGRGFFIVDAVTGKYIWHTENTLYDDLRYSVPSELRVIDINFDGLVDQIYFGDMGGQVWRFDYNNDNTAGQSISDRMSGDVIARFAGDEPENARRFYYPPDVALLAIDGEQQLSISIGSGWRAHPLDDVVEDRFYSFRMTQVYGAPTEDGRIRYPEVTESTTGMIDLSKTPEAVRTSNKLEKGWFLPMDPGEKVLSSSVTIDNSLVFTTYIPSAESDTCAAAIGSGAVYFLDLATGNPVKKLSAFASQGGGGDGTSGGDGNDDAGSEWVLDATDRRRSLAAAGIPPEATVLFPELGKATAFAGRDKLDEVQVDTLKTRTFWQEHIDENL